MNQSTHETMKILAGIKCAALAFCSFQFAIATLELFSDVIRWGYNFLAFLLTAIVTGLFITNLIISVMTFSSLTKGTIPTKNNLLISVISSAPPILFILYVVVNAGSDGFVAVLLSSIFVLFVSIFEFVTFNSANATVSFTSPNTTVQGTPDLAKLKEYKALLDAGAITQEEYNTLKSGIFKK